MTIVAANWVGENTSTVGTGPLALSGAISTFCPFSVLPDGSEVYYTLQEGFNRETGIGVVSNGTLTRKVQATLVAGVYTETDIPISLSGNGQVFAVINADFMTRIYNFSLDVADSVSAAAASAKSSADSAALANDHEMKSEQNAENASLYAQSASYSKADATASKNAAADSASAAASSQADALASKNAAKTSETNSKASENASAQYAANASNSAAAALASQNAAKTSEGNALESKTAAKTSETNAKASENNAKTSETNAKASENNAKTSETNAKASETAANSAKADAQTANGQMQALYDQTVGLVAGVQAPDKLPILPGGSRAWMNIAKVKGAGSSFAFVQFIIGGGSNYGASTPPVDIFSLSGCGLPTSPLTSDNIDIWFTQRSLVAAKSSTGRIKLGVVKQVDGSFDVYFYAPLGYIPEMWLNRLNVQANNGLITGPIINRTGYSWITTEPAGIVYNSPADYLMANDSTIPRTNVANTFSQPQAISVPGGNATLTLNGCTVMANNSNAILYSIPENGQGMYFRPNGDTNSAKQVVFDASNFSVTGLNANFSNAVTMSSTLLVNGDADLRGSVVSYGTVRGTVNDAFVAWPTSDPISYIGDIVKAPSFISRFNTHGNGANCSMWFEAYNGYEHRAVIAVSKWNNDGITQYWQFKSDGNIASTTYGNVVYAGLSDINYKDNVVDYDGLQSLENIKAMNLVKFTYKDDVKKRERRGVIAQQVQDIDSCYVKESNASYQDDDGNVVENKKLVLDNNAFLMDAICAIKALSAQVDELKEEIKNLKG